MIMQWLLAARTPVSAAFLLLVLALDMRLHAQSQQAVSKSGSQTSELREGLLDLLNETSERPEGSQADPRRNNGESRIQSRPDLEPEDVGLSGSDVSEQAANPLEAVRQSMLIAAGYLERGFTNQQTQELQGDIVKRLDDLIKQIDSPDQGNQQQNRTEERAQESPAQDRQQGRSQQSAGTQSEQQQQASTIQPDESSPESASDSTQSGTRGGEIAPQDQPGLSGQVADGEVDLSDPAVLQQSVWGQLPERVRKQMQSRMVERFLPSYREQIEAYFQSLLQTP